MTADLFVAGSRIVKPDAIVECGLGIRDGRIVAVLAPGETIAARRTIDAGGRPVLPGLLDTHVHLGTAAQSFADDCASEQQLVEAIMGTLALKGSPHWPIPELEKLWTEEALTAAVLPRYHVDVNVKRALGAKLGSLRDQGAA